jgi:hypothetical protein
VGQIHNGLAVPFDDRTVRDIRQMAGEPAMPRHVVRRWAIEKTHDSDLVITDSPEVAG